MSAIALDLTGQRFGLLTALYCKGQTKSRSVLWVCRCDCGSKSLSSAGNLRSGAATSCGCKWKSAEHSLRTTLRQLKHGYTTKTTHSRTYRSWAQMLHRCSGNAAPAVAKYYSDQRVRVCKRWRKFENFLADMGLRPAGRSIDRIDPFGNYEPSNCRWVTPKQQQANRRDRVRRAL
jgi:hypothetical protein